jgi:hypothetical protein
MAAGVFFFSAAVRARLAEAVEFLRQRGGHELELPALRGLLGVRGGDQSAFHQLPMNPLDKPGPSVMRKRP